MSENPFNNNLFNQVDAIVNAIDTKPRIVQCIQACNEEQLIEACMLQLYGEVDKIIVIEGAVQNKVAAGQATPDGHSLDRTVDIIKDVKANKDPDKKITFVQIDRPWADLEELKNTFFQYMQDGDWMLITDADEFLMPAVVGKLREAISLEPWATEFVPSAFHHFWRDVSHIRKPSGDWGQQHQRFIRFQPGLNYANHPVARDQNGVCTYFDPRYLSRRFVLPDFTFFHYSYCKDSVEEIQAKKDFYDRELGQEKHGDVGAYARGGQTDEFLNESEDSSTVLKFLNPHPPAVLNLPMYKYVDTRLDGMELDDHTTVAPHNLDKVPLIWIFSEEAKSGVPSRKGYDKLFNTVDA
jgi:hypothetical protein